MSQMFIVGAEVLWLGAGSEFSAVLEYSKQSFLSILPNCYKQNKFQKHLIFETNNLDDSRHLTKKNKLR